MESMILAITGSAAAASAISTAATVIGTLTSVAGALSQGQAQAAQAKAAANAQEYNATVARNNATLVSSQANAKEEAQRRHFGQLQGQAIAGVAQSGTGFEGSNYDLLKQNAVNNELDALTIRNQGENAAKGLIAQANLDTYNAGVSRMNAGNAITGSYFNAGANLMNGFTKYRYFDPSGSKPSAATGIP